MLGAIQKTIALEWPLRPLYPMFGHFNPLHPDHRRDPYPTWSWLRQYEPIYRSRAFRHWVISRHRDAVEVLRSPDFGMDRSHTLLQRAVLPILRFDRDLSDLIEHNVLNRDGPKHRRLREPLARILTTQRTEAIRPKLQGVVDQLLDRLSENGQLEVMENFASPLPFIAICELFSVPEAHRSQFQTWARDLAGLLDPYQARGGFRAMSRGAHGLANYFRPLVASRRRDQGTDLLSEIIRAELPESPLDDMDLISLCTSLLVAGAETTANLIGNAILALIRNPIERIKLQQNPELIDGAVHEFLRYDSPTQLLERVAQRDCQLNGQSIRRGDFVWIAVGAANRDPAVFDAPDRFEVERGPSPHLSFSQGAHHCPGIKLAHLETKLAIETLLRRFPDWTGDEPADWRRSMSLRGPQSLWIRSTSLP